LPGGEDLECQVVHVDSVRILMRFKKEKFSIIAI